jgi:hypothetical protein
MTELKSVQDELDQAEKELLMKIYLQIANDTGSEHDRSNLASTLAFSKFYPWNNARNSK